MSRSLIIGIVLTLLLLGGLTALFYQNFVRVKGRAAIEAVPNDAAIIVESKNISQAWLTLKGTEFWSDMQHNEVIDGLTQQINLIDSVLRSNSKLSGIVEDEKTVISFHKSGLGKIEFLIAMETGGVLEIEPFLSWLKEATHTSVRKRNFEKDEIFDLTESKQSQSLLSVALKDRILLLSHDGVLVEEGLRKLRYRIPAQTQGLNQAIALAKAGANLNVYVNYANLQSFFSVFARPERSSLLSFFNSFANWSVMNVDVTKERFNISGITLTDDSLFQFLDLFKNQEPVDLTFEEYLPRNTGFALMLGMSDYVRFNADLNEYLQIHNKQDYIHYNDSLENRYDIEIGRKLIAFAGKRAALFLSESANDDISKSLLAVVQFNNTQQVQSVLQEWTRAIDKRGEGDSVGFTYNNIAISRVKLGNFLKLIYGSSFEQISNPFYFVWNDAIYFGNDLDAVRLTIDNLNSSNLLSADSSYMAFAQYSSAMANVSVYFSPARLIQIPSVFANNDLISAWNRYQHHFRKAEHIGIQFAATSNKVFFTNFNLGYNSSFSEGSRMMWMTKIDTSLAVAPQVVFNSTTNQNCLLAQDLNKTLYFLNNSGTVQWKNKLTETIISPIHTIDFYRNGQTQYLFNTAATVYLIDVAGHNMAGYPVRLPGKASLPLSVFDFYGDSTLSYFVALDNKRIMGYTISGKPLQGWNPKQLDDKLNAPLRMTAMGMERILYSTGTAGKVYAYKSKGEKFELFDSLSNALLTSVYLNLSDTNKLLAYYTDTLHQLYYASNKGEPQLINLSVVPDNQFFAQRDDKVHFLYKSKGQIGLLAEMKKENFYETSDTLNSISYYEWNNDIFVKTGTRLVNIISGEMFDLPVEAYQIIGLGDLLFDKNKYVFYTDKQNNLIAYRLQ